MKVKGLQAVHLMMRSMGERVPDTARKQMHRAADRIVKRARIYVPEDTEALKNSIRIERSYGGRGRLQIDIIVGDASTVNAAGKTIDLNQYAAIIHERYRDFKPGQGTLDKRMQYPGSYIGEQFMTRAAEDEQPGLERNLVQAISALVTRGK